MADLRCHCLVFDHPRSLSHCNIENSHGLSWDETLAFASNDQIEIKFASEYTISKILESESPLPTSLLQRIGRATPLSADYAKSDRKSTKFVCGIGDEVRERLLVHKQHDVGEPDRFVVRVTLIIVLFIVLFAAGEAIWMSVKAFRNSKRNPIRLNGRERRLTAEGQPNDFDDKLQ